MKVYAKTKTSVDFFSKSNNKQLREKISDIVSHKFNMLMTHTSRIRHLGHVFDDTDRQTHWIL